MNLSRARFVAGHRLHFERALSASVTDATNMAAQEKRFDESGGHAMSYKLKLFLQHFADNVFRLFIFGMIVAGTALDTPFINVGLTAR